MHINKKSWHYAVYKWTYDCWFSASSMPQHTNLCQYVQRSIWMSVGVGLLTLLGWVVVRPLYVIIAIPIAWLIGYKPTRLNIFNEETDNPFKPYQTPRVPVLGTLLPVHFAALGVVALLEWAWFHYFGWQYPVFIQGGIVGAIGMIFSLVAYTDSDFSKVVAAWFAARKQGICPLVEFTEEPTSTNINE